MGMDALIEDKEHGVVSDEKAGYLAT